MWAQSESLLHVGTLNTSVTEHTKQHSLINCFSIMISDMDMTKSKTKNYNRRHFFFPLTQLSYFLLCWEHYFLNLIPRINIYISIYFFFFLNPNLSKRPRCLLLLSGLFGVLHKLSFPRTINHLQHPTAFFNFSCCNCYNYWKNFKH